MKESRFSVLGSLTVHVGAAVEPGPLKQRLTLATLLAHPNSHVSTEALTAAVWASDTEPRSARKNLQVYVSNLRRLLDDRDGAGDRLRHEAGGYRIRVCPDELDSLSFRELSRAGRQARDAGALTQAAQRFRRALAMWRGTPFAGLHRAPVLASAADRLTALRVQVFEDWAETELDLGNCAVVADRVADMVERYPQRERLRAAQMTALFRSGRQTEALEVFEEVRRHLAAAYDLQPTPALEALYRSMLADRRSRPAATAVPQALPQDVPDFVGRAEQTAEIANALRQRPDRPVVLAGSAGVGKSALAVHVAHRLRADFPDGRILVRMRDVDGRPRSSTDILAELAGLTGLSTQLTGHVEHDSGMWLAWVHGRQVLLVLDDVVEEAAVRLVAPYEGGSAALVTARRRLTGLAGAVRIDVPCLTHPEAVDLLAAIIGPERVAADRAAACDVVTATGRLPLAVRVGGLKLAAMPYLGLREYADRLTETPTVLDELVAGDLAVRPRIADSWYGLSHAHRTDVSRLASLPEPVLTLEDAASTLACPPEEARRRLESLIDTGAVLFAKPEVAARPVRYELPALVRLYARELAPTA